MNTKPSAPQTLATVAIACPWCAETMRVEDAFVASSIRCDACSTIVELTPLAVAAARPIRAAA